MAQGPPLQNKQVPQGVLKGVPQGFVLGPILYSLFTVDLPEMHTTTTFAADTTLLASNTNSEEAFSILQAGLDQIEDWLQKWRIKTSASKSTHVICTQEGKLSTSQIRNKYFTAE